MIGRKRGEARPGSTAEDRSGGAFTGHGWIELREVWQDPTGAGAWQPAKPVGPSA